MGVTLPVSIYPPWYGVGTSLQFLLLFTISTPLLDSPSQQPTTFSFSFFMSLNKFFFFFHSASSRSFAHKKSKMASNNQNTNNSNNRQTHPFSRNNQHGHNGQHGTTSTTHHNHQQRSSSHTHQQADYNSIARQWNCNMNEVIRLAQGELQNLGESFFLCDFIILLLFLKT